MFDEPLNIRQVAVVPASLHDLVAQLVSPPTDDDRSRRPRLDAIDNFVRYVLVHGSQYHQCRHVVRWRVQEVPGFDHAVVVFPVSHLLLEGVSRPILVVAVDVSARGDGRPGDARAEVDGSLVRVRNGTDGHAE